MYFTDIHNHMIYGVDDGAKTQEDMFALIDASYADGVRHLCFTPHYHPGFFGDHGPEIKAAFRVAYGYVSQKYPDLSLHLGNELRYERSCTDWVAEGKCTTINGSNYLMVDFLYPEPADNITSAMLRVLNAGYIPILAHVERYEKLSKDLSEVERMRSWGVILQIDSQSPIGGLGRNSKVRSRKILEAGLADFIASDAHDLNSRPPQLQPCYEFVSKHYGEDYAKKLFWDNPIRILCDKPL